MAGFLGSYLHSIDPKGRVSLPAQFRRGHESESFVLIHAQPDALSLYTDERWGDEVQSELREMAKRQPDLRMQILALTASAVEVAPDKQGRILIPEKMRLSVSLDSEALVVGAINHIEIWEPARFREKTKEKDEAFDRYVKTVFT